MQVIYELEGLAQANAVLTSSNYAVMAQLVHMTVTINAMQDKLKTLASEQTNQAKPKRKHYFWSYGINFTPGEKPGQQRKRDIKRKRTTIIGWVAVKRDVNDG